MAAAERFRTLNATGESRRKAKIAIREASRSRQWSVSTGRIHSYSTLHSYQQVVFAFIRWARATHGINRLDRLDERADELATAYLTARIETGCSPYTIQKERAALRLFFNDRDLALAVPLPKRTREQITRSRGPASSDRHFQPANWQTHIQFEQACGLRRSELRDLRIRDIYYDHSGALVVHVVNGKGGREREVPVIPGCEQAVLSVIAGRDPDERVFSTLPKHWDIHSERRAYAQALYLHYANRTDLPKASGRLRSGSYDRSAAERVSWALGHNRMSVALRHYLR